jgi:hypothetical protein
MKRRRRLIQRFNCSRIVTPRAIFLKIFFRGVKGAFSHHIRSPCEIGFSLSPLVGLQRRTGVFSVTMVLSL